MEKQFEVDYFGDEGYRWNDTIVPDMADDERNAYFLASAHEMMLHREPEIAYEILRELVWRSPKWKPESWQLLSECAEIMGKHKEASIASNNYALLKQGNP